MSFLKDFFVVCLAALPIGLVQAYFSDNPWAMKATICLYGYLTIGYLVDAAKFPGDKESGLRRLYLAFIWPMRLLGR